MPFDNITKRHFGSGDYPQAMQRALAEIDVASVRARQRQKEPDGRLVGVGLSVYCEQAAHGTSVYAGWGIPMVPGHEQATARMTPDGGLEIRVSVHSHGQGLETTLAQVAHEILGIDTAKVRVIHGDTALTPYSTGTCGSHSMVIVMAGGAVGTACAELAERAKKKSAQSYCSSIHRKSPCATAAYADRTAASTCPRLPTVMRPSACWGYFKACRKPGEFAHAIAAVLIDPEAAAARVVIGAIEAAPIVVSDAAPLFGGRIADDFKREFDTRVVDSLLAKAGVANAANRHIHVAVLRRAIDEAAA